MSNRALKGPFFRVTCFEPYLGHLTTGYSSMAHFPPCIQKPPVPDTDVPHWIIALSLRGSMRTLTWRCGEVFQDTGGNKIRITIPELSYPLIYVGFAWTTKWSRISYGSHGNHNWFSWPVRQNPEQHQNIKNTAFTDSFPSLRHLLPELSNHYTSSN